MSDRDGLDEVITMPGMRSEGAGSRSTDTTRATMGVTMPVTEVVTSAAAVAPVAIRPMAETTTVATPSRASSTCCAARAGAPSDRSRLRHRRRRSPDTGHSRCVPCAAESDLHTSRDDARTLRNSIRHLEDESLIRRSALNADDRAVTLTDHGRNLLEAARYAHHERARKPRQTFWAGLKKPRELTHDTSVYRAYQRIEERLRSQGGTVRRVVLDYELKRDYQRFLHEHNRGKRDCDGRPDREPEDIARWAREHELPNDDGHVRFPDARVEYEDRDGRSRHEDLEVVTGHYRGAHAGAALRSGFTCYLSLGGSVGGCSGGRTAHPRIIEELIR